MLQEKMSGKKIVVYGTINKLKDIQYVFDELDICVSTRNEQDVLHYVLDKGYFALLCEEDNRKMIEFLEANELEKEKNYCIDYELIATLNYPLQKYRKNRRIIVWGTGIECEKFLKIASERNLNISIEAFVDSDFQKQQSQTYKNKAVLSPDSIKADADFVIVATGYEHFFEIEKELQKKKFSKTDFIHYCMVIDDVASYFMQTYKSKKIYDAECKIKDNAVRIDWNGNLCTCCMSYSSVYGNLFENTFEELWYSKRAKISRLALENRTYCFCDQDRCPYLCGARKRIRDDEVRTDAYKYIPKQYPDSIAPEIDRSCNLRCVSCRNEVFVDNSTFRNIYAEMILEKIVNLPVRLILNTVGEPFASKNCLKVINDERTQKRKTLSIYSNGTLLFPNVMDELLEKYETLELAISVDAATKETYEKIRRNGKFDVLLQNLDYMGKLKKNNKITWFQLNFVLETENISEMEMFIRMGERLGVDRIEINKIEQWGTFSEERFEEITIIRNGTIKEELQKYFKKEMLELDWVDFFNLSSCLGIEPKRNYMM